MGLEIERIHACPNDCMLYRNEYANLHNCIRCGTSRYKRKQHVEENSDDEMLVIDGSYKFPCAKGMVHSVGSGLCHSVPAKENYVKVLVDQVKSYFAKYPFPVPNDEMGELGEARNSFIQ